MSTAILIRATNTAGPAAKAVSRAITPARLNPVIGRSANNTVREHLFGLNSTRPNALGGRRTNFYAQAARATNFKVVSDTAIVVSIPHVGIAQRFFGGTIRPKSGTYLTIPVHPAAHGKRAREFDLELVFGLGGQPIALATKRTVAGRSGRQISAFGEIYYKLVREVIQRPDETVLPYNELIAARVQTDVNAVVNRAIASASGGAS